MSNDPKYTQVDWGKSSSTNSRGLITESAKCENCSHSDVCSIKNNLGKLKITTRDLAKLLENKDFSITVTCKYYIRNTGNIR